MLGTYALSAGYYDAYYGKAQQVRTLIRRDFEAAFEQVDVIAAPTTPAVAFKLGEKDDPLAMYLTDIFTVPGEPRRAARRLGAGGLHDGGAADRPAAHRPRLRARPACSACAHAYEQATDVAHAAGPPWRPGE